MKNELQPATATLSTNCQCRRAPRRLSIFFDWKWGETVKKPPMLYLLMKRQLQLPFQFVSGNDPIWARCAIADAEQVWGSRNPHSGEERPRFLYLFLIYIYFFLYLFWITGRATWAWSTSWSRTGRPSTRRLAMGRPRCISLLRWTIFCLLLFSTSYF